MAAKPWVVSDERTPDRVPEDRPPPQHPGDDLRAGRVEIRTQCPLVLVGIVVEEMPALRCARSAGEELG